MTKQHCPTCHSTEHAWEDCKATPDYGEPFADHNPWYYYILYVLMMITIAGIIGTTLYFGYLVLINFFEFILKTTV